jgi:hypothetical protein
MRKVLNTVTFFAPKNLSPQELGSVARSRAVTEYRAESTGVEMSKKTVLILLVAFMTWLPHANAQAANDTQKKNEVGLVIGATVTPGLTLASGISATPRTLTFKPSLALGAEFDHRLNASQGLGVLVGLDFVASPLDVKLDQRPPNVIPQYAYLFLTPHIRVKFRPNGAIVPWLLLGGGFARLTGVAPSTAIAFKAGTNTGALVFGGGIDTGIVHRFWKIPVGFRLEVRDFYSGQANYNLPLSGSMQHNIVFTGGLLIKF